MPEKFFDLSEEERDKGCGPITWGEAVDLCSSIVEKKAKSIYFRHKTQDGMSCEKEDYYHFARDAFLYHICRLYNGVATIETYTKHTLHWWIRERALKECFPQSRRYMEQPEPPQGEDVEYHPIEIKEQPRDPEQLTGNDLFKKMVKKVSQKEVKPYLFECYKRLTVRQLEFIIRFCYQDLIQKEIAEEMDIDKSRVNELKKQSVKNLVRCLKEQIGEEGFNGLNK